MFRNYNIQSKQAQLYKKMYVEQTLENVIKIRNKYNKRKGIKISIKQLLLMLDDFVDDSDPDLDLPNSVHAYQTAEKIREKYPDDYEMQITGLIHDLGKILYKFGEPQHYIVGDTFVLGAKFPKSMVFYNFIKLNPDFDNSNYNTKFGIYKANCGLDELILSYGHDEYLYNILKKNNHKLTDKYLNIIRYHSFYPWHSHNEYRHFMKDSDYEILENVNKFNEFDLYSKENEDFIDEDIKKYYDKLLDIYFPEDLII